MKRVLENYLVDWKQKQTGMPLLIRGARQVGKSFTIEQFGNRHFQNLVCINFEFDPHLKDYFQTLNPHDIVNRLQLILNVSITNNTLIFFDEIQECPPALLSLRYFKEKMPHQPVIAAGSLLEFLFREEDFRFPVGRIQFLNLEPLSFAEFLLASGNERLRDHRSRITVHTPVDTVIHVKLLDLLRTYLVIGGMPEVVYKYVTNNDLLECQRLQTGLLETYRKDFGKYANLSHHKYLRKVFDAAPRLVGQRVKYVNIDRETKSRDLKNALEMLALARVVRPVYLSKASGLPLGAMVDERKFKLTFVDIGLMQKGCGLQVETQSGKDIMQINAGAVAEQFTAQELRAVMDPYQDNDVYFWARDKQGSMAEIDYLLAYDHHVIPIEVKAGKAGKLKSLRLFLKQKKSPVGIRISTDNISFQDNILSVPLYMIDQIPRLLGEVL